MLASDALLTHISRRALLPFLSTSDPIRVFLTDNFEATDLASALKCLEIIEADTEFGNKRIFRNACIERTSMMKIAHQWNMSVFVR